MKKLVILGESHTRHFSFRKNIMPIFMGNGKVINLDNIDGINAGLSNATSKLSNSINFLYVGEPNARLKLTNHWTPHWDDLLKGKTIDPTPNVPYIKKSVENFGRINLEQIDYIITPTCGYDPVIPSLRIMNEMLSEKFGNKMIDIFSESVDGDKVKEEYKAPNWKQDPIHLNSKICNVFLDVLFERSIIEDKEEYKKLVEYEFGTWLIKDNNYKMTNFGSYILKEPDEE